MQNNKPNLFIVGAAKCATTSIHYYLSQHPDISMSSVKEPHFFSDVKSKHPADYQRPKKGEYYHTRIVKDEETYLSLFENESDKIYRGEASPSYLYDNHAAAKIFKFNPEARILIILREPVARTVSHYKMDFNSGEQSEGDIVKAIELDSLDSDKTWGAAHLYIELGLYYEQIKRYSALFPAEQIHILKFEDFVSNPIVYIKQVLCFLGLETASVDNFQIEARNEAAEIKNPIFKKLFLYGRTNRLLTSAKSLFPSYLKNRFKSYMYQKQNNKAVASERSDLQVFQYLNETYFLKDKNLLKEYYSICWD